MFVRFVSLCSSRPSFDIKNVDAIRVTTKWVEITTSYSTTAVELSKYRVVISQEPFVGEGC